MLPKLNRANAAEITFVREEGQFIAGPLFSLLIADLTDQKPSRFAFIVSTKLSKRAVVRNRAKRLLREAGGSLLKKMVEGKIVLFLAKKSLLGQNSQIVNQEVAILLTKGLVIRKGRVGF